MLRFGGAGAVAPLHALGRPFTDADGPRVLSQMRFAQVRCAHRLSRLCRQCRASLSISQTFSASHVVLVIVHSC